MSHVCGKIIPSIKRPVFQLPPSLLSARYMTFFRCKQQFCFLLKDSVLETGHVLFQSDDPRVFDMSVWRNVDVPDDMSHNFALFVDTSRYVGVGGQYRENETLGINIAYSESLFNWTMKSNIISGKHSGCLECRRPYVALFRLRSFNGNCEFDGRLSFIKFKNRFLLYSRSNIGTAKRYVQVSQSHDLKTWKRFERINIDVHLNNIYFWGVMQHADIPGVLLSIFPSVHDHRGCIGLAVSLDGISWRILGSLQYCGIFGERSLNHPVIGLHASQNTTVFYVHENVFLEVESIITYCHTALRYLLSQIGMAPVADVIYSSIVNRHPRVVSHEVNTADLRIWIDETLAKPLRTIPYDKCENDIISNSDYRPMIMIFSIIAICVIILCCVFIQYFNFQSIFGKNKWFLLRREDAEI